MLKNVPKIITPDLLKILSEMGHGDEIVIADGNFPSKSVAGCSPVVRYDAIGVPHLLDAILALFPLDTYVDKPVFYMGTLDGSTPPIWDEYKKIFDKHGYNGGIELVERFAFYEQAKKAYAIIASGESAIYANIILKKGIVV